ncbi:MAG TPA: DUF2905 domain-containing protein, partial [Proteobacteria bacterium]|nr:DUF2905 domain-containing protein [Pseudomonadota bacterium]
MEPQNIIGMFLIVAGVAMLVVGILVYLSPNIPLLGKLPGDIRIERDGFRFYFPFTTCIILSIILTFILNL